MKKQLLGRGLATLISESEDMLYDLQKDVITELEINLISPNPQQPRKSFDFDKIKELASSIKEHGFIQPLVVCKLQGEPFYTLIAGERRYRAAKEANLKKVPVIIKQVEESNINTLALIENIQRERLDPVEESLAIKKLIEHYNATHDEIAKKIGKSRAYISNAIRMLNLPQDVLDSVREGELSSAHARVLSGSENPSQDAKQFIEQKLNVRQAENYMKASKKGDVVSVEDYKSTQQFNTAKHKAAEAFKDADILQLENILKENLNLSANIVLNNQKNGSGSVTIDFDDMKQLDDIIQSLMANFTVL